MTQKSVKSVVDSLRRRDCSQKTFELSHTIRVASKYYKCLNTPVALSCFLLLKHGEYDQLVTKSVKPIDYDDGELFRNDYAAVKFLAKCADLPTTFNLDQEALKVEAWAEAQCQQTNRRILKTFPDFRVNRIRCIAQDIISEILGETPSFEDLCSRFRYGPGATSATTDSATTIVAKTSCNLHVTPQAFYDGQLLVQYVPGLDSSFNRSLDFVGPVCGPRISDVIIGNTYISVPKNAKTNRAIAIPVHLNTGQQLAIGSILRERLSSSRWKLNLDNLWTINQKYAELGSLGVHTDGYQYITVDITCASSTIAIETIFDLLPRSWALLLDRWREHHTMYGEHVHQNHKFSSMGNGFTFELESLIFFALAKAAQINIGEHSAVCTSFGDDIISTSTSYIDLCEVFRFYGLLVNEAKSYSDGPFRESCGADYWQGARINPPYLKETIKNESSVVKLANRIRDYSCRIRFGYFCDVQFKSVWLCLIDLLPNDTDFTFGSLHYGDTVVWNHPSDRGLSRPLFDSGQFFTRFICHTPRKRKHIRFENSLGAWASKVPSYRNSINNPISIDLSGPNIGPYGTLYRNLRANLEAVVLPTHERGKTGRFTAKIGSSSVMNYFPPWS